MFIRQTTYVRFLSVCVIFCFLIGCLFNFFAPTDSSCNCDSEGKLGSSKYSANLNDNGENRDFHGKPNLAILVPFRDRFEELLRFAPHMDKFLKAQRIPFHIFILNQVDRFRFNRASLINAGFLHTEKDFRYIAMHDVDLLPLNKDLVYKFPKHGPLHIAAPELHPKYHYPTFVGGILLVNREHFRLTNGMSNKYWGWGLEDDEFYVRLMDAGLEVSRPQNIKTGINDTFLHIHDRAHRKRDMVKCFNQREVTRKRDRETGLNSLKYQIKAVHNLTINSVPLTILNVHLDCDKATTPWCDCEGSSAGETHSKTAANKSKNKM